MPKLGVCVDSMLSPFGIRTEIPLMVACMLVIGRFVCVNSKKVF